MYLTAADGISNNSNTFALRQLRLRHVTNAGADGAGIGDVHDSESGQCTHSFSDRFGAGRGCRPARADTQSCLAAGCSLLVEERYAAAHCFYHAVYWKMRATEAAGAPATWNVGAGAALNYITVSIVDYRGGFNQANPIDAWSSSPYNTIDDGILHGGGVTTSAANEYLLFVGGAYNQGAAMSVLTAPTGFAQDWFVNDTTNYFLRYFAHLTLPQAAAGATGNQDATMSYPGSPVLPTTSFDVPRRHGFLIALNPQDRAPRARPTRGARPLGRGGRQFLWRRRPAADRAC